MINKDSNLSLNLRIQFAAVLFIFFSVSCSVQHKYLKEARKWEKNIVKFDSLNKSEQYPKDAILFTGSSSIVLWSTLKEDVAPYSVIQRGFGGSKFSDLACYTDRIVYPHDFKALVIFEANDITGTKWDKSPGEVEKLFRYIVKEVRKKYPENPIFVIEITPSQSRWNAWPQIRELNTLLSNASKELHHVYYIPTASYYLDQAGKPRPELFRDDKLHMNRAGYTIWGKLIKGRLDEVFLKQ